MIDDASLHSAPTYVYCKAGKLRSVTGAALPSVPRSVDGDVGQETEVKDATGRYRHARRAPVDENTHQPMRVSKAGAALGIKWVETDVGGAKWLMIRWHNSQECNAGLSYPWPS